MNIIQNQSIQTVQKICFMIWPSISLDCLHQNSSQRQRFAVPRDCIWWEYLGAYQSNAMRCKASNLGPIVATRLTLSSGCRQPQAWGTEALIWNKPCMHTLHSARWSFWWWVLLQAGMAPSYEMEGSLKSDFSKGRHLLPFWSNF